MPIQVVARSGRALLNYAVDFVFDDATKRTVVGNIVPVLDADGRPDGAVAAFVDITERRQAEQERERLQAEVLAAERARAELAENLNRETSHRTKNNLAMVAGLLQMQMAESRKPEVSAALREATGRVLAFATLHEQLQSGLGDEADVLGLVRRIANVTSGIFAFRSVALSVQGHPAVCPRGVATNLAVVANELITNAIKHGAPGPEGEQEVKVRVAPEDGELRLSVWNSGPPVPAGFDPTAQPGLGLRLVWSIVVEQYGGSFTLRPHEGGSLAQLTVGDPCLPEQETSGPGLPPG
jgi:two-component sensor histidine kinase